MPKTFPNIGISPFEEHPHPKVFENDPKRSTVGKILPSIINFPDSGPCLNLGAGNDLTPGFIRIDIGGNPDIIADIRNLPITSDFCAGARMFHILEHLPRESLVPIMNETWRVLRVGGILDIEVPIFPSDDAIGDPTHVSFFVPRTFEYFEVGGPYEEHRVLYQIKPWKRINRQRLGANSILRIALEKVPE